MHACRPEGLPRDCNKGDKEILIMKNYGMPLIGGNYATSGRQRIIKLKFIFQHKANSKERKQ